MSQDVYNTTDNLTVAIDNIPDSMDESPEVNVDFEAPKEIENFSQVGEAIKYFNKKLNEPYTWTEEAVSLLTRELQTHFPQVKSYKAHKSGYLQGFFIIYMNNMNERKEIAIQPFSTRNAARYQIVRELMNCTDIPLPPEFE